MPNTIKANPENVFRYFSDIASIPHGSGNTDKISEYCERFAKEHKLKYVRDSFNNVVIYKDGSTGYENASPVILQGHIDMVCQKDDGCNIDFLNDGLDVFTDGDFVKARGTTLGADNGIAAAMILAVLDSDLYAHPPVEAVFTTDEETGMGGALNLDTSLLKGAKMINLDSEEDDTMTVSCCGGCCLKVDIPFTREEKQGDLFEITLNGLFGGHSGMEIDKGRVNANSLAGRFLNHLRDRCAFNLVSVDGGDKTNAITNNCKIKVLTDDSNLFKEEVEFFVSVLKNEFSSREPNFNVEIKVTKNQTVDVIPEREGDRLVSVLATAPQGVVAMSGEIPGLVETSTNIGVVSTGEGAVTIRHSFRSNKESCMDYLKETVCALYRNLTCEKELYGEYPAWDFNPDSSLQELYKECYKEHYKKDIKVSAVHAGLECGIFSSKIKNLDCISIGPNMFGVHTTNEKLSISSTEKFFGVLLKLLMNLK